MVVLKSRAAAAAIAVLAVLVLTAVLAPAEAQFSAQPAGKPAVQPADTKPKAGLPAANVEAAAPEPSPTPTADAGKKNATGYFKPSAEAVAAERARAEAQDAAASDPAIPDTAKDIAPLLAQHPDSNVIICMAGCGPMPSIVQVVAKVDASIAQAEGEMEQNAADGAGTGAGKKPVSGDIVCLAGCLGKRGDVIYRNVRLSWLSPEQGTHLKTALQAIADRLAANERAADMAVWPGRMWVSQRARAELIGREHVARAATR